ncbi:MAG: hypothetical protein O7D91_09340 [Planctomycetota bacterium]|nr:hypothetical protein [Planctomycetota bacterium]
MLVCLETEALIIQVKERDTASGMDAVALERWFTKKVVGKGSDQIADTISFLADHSEIRVKNARGREFRLGELAAETAHIVIVFGSLSCPSQLREQARIHMSKRSGPIHLIEASDFRNLLRWTVTPREMLSYLDFRERYLGKREFARMRSEKWLFGRFVGSIEAGCSEIDDADFNGEAVVESLVDDALEVDLRRFLNHIGEWAASGDGRESIFYKLILECAHLPRATMREFKKRMLKCQNRLDKPIPETLYRIVNPERDCVFVFGVMPRNEIGRVEIDVMNMAQLAKYDCGASKVVGFFFTPGGEDDVGTTPVFIEDTWKQDKEADAMLAKFNPFRPLKKDIIYGYFVDPRDNAGSSEGHTRCGKCGYILKGLTEPRCSECGERI